MPIVITDSAPRGRRRGTDTAAGNLSSSKRSRLYRATPTAGGDRAARYETATPRVGKKRESQHRHRPRTLRLQTPTAWMHPNKSDAWQCLQQAVSASRPPLHQEEDEVMIVLGADTHKRSHTIAAVAAASGELLGEQTVQVGHRGFGALLQWARGLDNDRVWALEDCRHVSGSLERFLIERGERPIAVGL